MRLLFICTGNICRSPLAERLASAWAEQALGAGAATVHVRSAGMEALDGRPMDSRSAAALKKLGGEPGGFVAQSFVPAMAESADLIFTMTRRHRRLVLTEAPRAMRRTFTLAEAADLLLTVNASGVRELPLADRARELATRLNSGRPRRRSADADDMHDPIGQASSVHDYVAARIARKLRPLTETLFAEEHAERRRASGPDRLARPPLPHVPPRPR